MREVKPMKRKIHEQRTHRFIEWTGDLIYFADLCLVPWIDWRIEDWHLLACVLCNLYIR